MKNKYLIINAVLILAIVIFVGILYVVQFSSFNKSFNTSLPVPYPSTYPSMSIQGWKTATSTAQGVVFKYPETISKTYVHSVDWPPEVQATSGPLTCTQAGSETAPAGKTEERVIGSRTYCITKESQGAAGSIYTMYAYATSKADKVVIFTFSLQFPQCVNYTDPQQMSACQSEEQNFSMDGIINRMVSTLTFL